MEGVDLMWPKPQLDERFQIACSVLATKGDRWTGMKAVTEIKDVVNAARERRREKGATCGRGQSGLFSVKPDSNLCKTVCTVILQHLVAIQGNKVSKDDASLNILMLWKVMRV